MKQCQKPCSSPPPPPLYQDLSTRHDWPVKKAIVDLPITIRLNRTSKRISGNSLRPLEALDKDFGEKVKLPRYCKLGGSAPQEKFSNLEAQNSHILSKKTKATGYISSVIGKVQCLQEKRVKH